MTFTYPLGLLALIAIPVLIAIYIIKNRFTEQTIPSTYIWTLSEKFLRHRVPISKIAGIISLILQILIALCIAFVISQPVITIANSANSYCFILDGSGSMNFVQDDETRFELAKDEITDIINKSMNGSDYTLIYAGNTTETIYEHEMDKKAAKQILSELHVSYNAVDMDEALNIAKAYFNENPSILTYLFTDENYDEAYNVTVVNVAKSVKNYALSDVYYLVVGEQLNIYGTATSYENEGDVTVDLRFNSSDVVYDSQSVTASQSGTQFEFVCDLTEFESFTLSITNKDGLMLDNEITIYDLNYDVVRDILIVSDSPFFIKSALSATGLTDDNITMIETKQYSSQLGYGLYIFDNFMPNVLPDDGAVWFMNPQGSLSNTNFSYQGPKEYSENEIYVAKYTDSSASTVNKLFEGVTKRNFELRNYVKCGLSGKFETLISCEGDPLLFVGNNNLGNRQVVFTFDLHDSAEFTLMGDFSSLVKNLVDYSFPSVVDKTYFTCGEIMDVNMVTGVNNIIIQTPDGKKVYTDPYVAVNEHQLTQVGVYSIILEMKDKSERIVKIYSSLPAEERLPITTGESFSVNGLAEFNKTDGYFELALILFILIAVLAIADYGVYCYEQYQLR